MSELTVHAAEPAEDRFARLLNTALTGRWHVWYVRLTGQRASVWCARPEGARTATLQAGTAYELAAVIGAMDTEAGAALGTLPEEIAAEYPS